MLSRILSILRARNREFYRDRAGLGWNIVMPMMFVFAFAFIFDGGPETLLKIGVVAPPGHNSALTDQAGVQEIHFDSRDVALKRLERHQLDLVVDPTSEGAYWINEHSTRGALAEQLLLGLKTRHSAEAPDTSTSGRQTVSGQALRYVDWVLPGVLAMNLMFSSLWGVGWVVVRYRKNGVLRRLQATPLSALEFLIAQVASRLLVVMSATIFVYLGADLLLDFIMRGSLLTLLLVFMAGALCMISVGLVVASRLRTEEVADGVLNLIAWPMMLLSGVWFSMDGASGAAQTLSQLMPLTYLVSAARRVMVDGAGLHEVLPEVALLLGASVLLLSLAARLFRWS